MQHLASTRRKCWKYRHYMAVRAKEKARAFEARADRRMLSHEAELTSNITI